MKILEEKISKKDLLLAEVVFEGPMVKGVVDTERRILAIDANMHADLEQVLLSDGSKQESLWGINLYPEDDDFVVTAGAMILDSVDWIMSLPAVKILIY